MNAWHALFALLVFPGPLYALPMGWFMLGAGRKLDGSLSGADWPAAFHNPSTMLSNCWPSSRWHACRRRSGC
jgi:hypothetical protein